MTMNAKKIVQQLLKENPTCADCDSKGGPLPCSLSLLLLLGTVSGSLITGPKWVSVSFGVFLCKECSGVHRSLGGGELSYIKSVEIELLPEELGVLSCFIFSLPAAPPFIAGASCVLVNPFAE